MIVRLPAKDTIFRCACATAKVSKFVEGGAMPQDQHPRFE
jgi:hypothetical protein